MPILNRIVNVYHQQQVIRVFFAEKLQRAKANKKESCPFCQEQKKRPLIAYMRKRAQEKNGKICEEVQEEEEEAGQTHCHNGHVKDLRK